MGSRMVPFKRALVSSFRPSIVTFPLSFRVSEISPCSLELGGSPLGYEERRCWDNCPCIISFQDFQPV